MTSRSRHHSDTDTPDIAGRLRRCGARRRRRRQPRPKTPPADKATPGIFRYKIGSYELTALYDGIWYRPITDKFIQGAVCRRRARARSGLHAARQAGDAVHDADRQYRQETGADRHRHRRPDLAVGRRAARQSRRRRHRSQSGRSDRHLAFSSRPHQRHQGQGQRADLPQCRDHGAGAGMGLLDERRQYECRGAGSETHLPQSAAHFLRYRRRR